MKTLTKLALVSAVAISGNAFALQSLDDSALSATTGQDGITIGIGGSGGTIIGADVVIHDRGGFEDGVVSGVTRASLGLPASPAADTTNGKKNAADGAIVLQGFAVKSASNSKINVVIDSDANGTTPVLNVNIGLPSDLIIETGTVYVAKSNGINAAATGQYSNQAKILDNVSVALGGSKMNLQLGNQPQGALIKMGGTITGGLTISNLNILQGNNGIGLGSVNLKTAGTNDLAITANISATATGLDISGLGNADVRLTDVKLGNLATGNTTPTLGNVAMLGLAMPTLTISGH